MRTGIGKRKSEVQPLYLFSLRSSDKSKVVTQQFYSL